MAHQLPSECGDPHRVDSSEDTLQRVEGRRIEGAAAAPSDDWGRETTAPAGSAMMMHGSHSRPSSTSPSRHFLVSTSRSLPIAIRRNTSTSSSAVDTTTSDEDDEGDDDVDASGSAKNGLLRAPYLGSLPSNVELMSNPNLLLPAAADSSNLTTGEGDGENGGGLHRRGTVAASYSGGGVGVGRTGYGSLRESNMMGRFVDGPASYRERGTGGIVQLRNRVRFDAPSSYSNQPSSPSKQPISIGDQLMMHARKQENSEGDSSTHEPQPPSSSLAAMLESSSLENSSPLKGTDEWNAAPMPPVDNAPTLSHFDDFQSADPDVLSMSLTGLEVLHSLRHLRGSASQSGFNRTTSSSLHRPDLETLPRDTNGHNALLSRSFSDPMPRFRRTDPPPRHPPVGSPTINQRPGPYPTFLIPPTPAPTPTATAFDFHDTRLPSAVFVASAIPVPAADEFPTRGDDGGALLSNDADRRGASPMWEVDDDGALPPANHDNPDTEGAFEMDLE